VWGVVQFNTKRLQAQKRRLAGLVKERTQELELRNVELEQQKEEIMTIAENLRQAHDEISLQHKNTKASINYAKRIQTAILPFAERMSETFPHHFIYYAPRDVVSGDFYFFEDKGDKVLLAVVDCTGHGVPGAFMSMIGYVLLNDIINKENILEPDLVLNELHKGIRHSLRQKQTQNNDGMDIGVLVWDKSAHSFSFAGARNNLIYFRNQELHQIKGDKLLIGGEQREIERIFSRQTVVLEPNEEVTFYLYSDGFHDQFGGEIPKKYSTPRLKEFLTRLQRHDMKTQKELAKEEFLSWKGNQSQTDDVMLIGIKI
jgi:serine phosphatase RsbU (regulator of sigma subunit)